MKHRKLIISIVLLLLISIPTFLYFNYSNNKTLVKNTSSTNNSESTSTNTDNDSNSNSTTNDSNTKKTESTTNNSNSDSSTSAMAANMTYLSVNDFANSLNCINYTIKAGDTLTSICSKYATYCNLNTSINLVTLINKITKPEELTIGDTLKIPESTLVSGTLYTVTDGDTWYKLRDTYYKNYDIDNIMNFIIDLNQLPNDELPLGETLFLPSLSV